MGVLSSLGLTSRAEHSDGAASESVVRNIVLREPVGDFVEERLIRQESLVGPQDLSGCVDAVEFSFLLDEALEEAELIGSETGVIFLNAGLSSCQTQRLARRLRAAGVRELIGVRSDHRFAIIFEGCSRAGLANTAETVMDVCRSLEWSNWEQADERAPHIVAVHCSPRSQATAASIYVKADAIQKRDTSGGIATINLGDE